MNVQIHVLGPGDAAELDLVAPGVFDHAISARWAAEFLADPRHHLAIARDMSDSSLSGHVVGMASGVHYVHPDKPPELWVNEVGVAPSHEGQGIGRRLLAALLARGRELGCQQAWVLTNPTNLPACRMYEAVGGVADPEPLRMYEFPLT
ncbi:MAG: GNAT family N-acetyltransferase [Gemmatimonadetes bacterium]|nr:MAG: GNAT family N-acetyltransferase [Gemmatimonadota bacterium]HMC54236.1 GNAT family N-acetyltransferase [Gemmatimonadaceae bacterium]